MEPVSAVVAILAGKILRRKLAGTTNESESSTSIVKHFLF